MEMRDDVVPSCGPGTMDGVSDVCFAMCMGTVAMPTAHLGHQAVRAGIARRLQAVAGAHLEHHPAGPPPLMRPSLLLCCTRHRCCLMHSTKVLCMELLQEAGYACSQCQSMRSVMSSRSSGPTSWQGCAGAPAASHCRMTSCVVTGSSAQGCM